MIPPRPVWLIFASIASKSGYGAMSRSITRNIIELFDYDYNQLHPAHQDTAKYAVKIIPMAFAMSQLNALDPIRDKLMIDRILPQPVQLARTPAVALYVGIPPEQQMVPGAYNILYSALVESNCLPLQWIKDMNRNNLILTLSEHCKNVANATIVEEKNAEGTVMNTYHCDKPVEIIPVGIDTSIFRKIDPMEVDDAIKDTMIDIKEKFCFLSVGQMVPRKNFEGLVKIFCETFKGTISTKRPALVLKTNGATTSIVDREFCLNRIREIRESCGPNAPNVYLLHGDLTDSQMNSLMNHPKMKAFVSFAYGEGQGCPMLEYTMSGKPVISSAWSGPMDFLSPEESILVGGEVKPIPPHVVYPGVLIPESQVFHVEPNTAATALMWCFNKWEQFVPAASKLGKKNSERFSQQAIQERTKDILMQHLPVMADIKPINLPKLKKIVPRKIEESELSEVK